MKSVAKIFQGKKPQSSGMNSGSSRTSSSSSATSTSPHSFELSPGSMAGTQRDSLEYGKSSSSREGNATRKSGKSYGHRHGGQRASTSHMDPEHRELADAFKIIDTDGDGKISVSELGAILRSLGDDPSQEELQLMVEAVDADGDGYIDLQEFIDLNRKAAAKAGTETRSEELRAAFCVFDIDKNDYISAEELHQVMGRLGQDSLTLEECDRMIRSVDSDGDGYVDFEEFERMMSGNRG